MNSWFYNSLLLEIRAITNTSLLTCNIKEAPIFFKQLWKTHSQIATYHKSHLYV